MTVKTYGHIYRVNGDKTLWHFASLGPILKSKRMRELLRKAQVYWATETPECFFRTFLEPTDEFADTLPAEDLPLWKDLRKALDQYWFRSPQWREKLLQAEGFQTDFMDEQAYYTLWFRSQLDRRARFRVSPQRQDGRFIRFVLFDY